MIKFKKIWEMKSACCEKCNAIFTLCNDGIKDFEAVVVPIKEGKVKVYRKSPRGLKIREYSTDEFDEEFEVRDWIYIVLKDDAENVFETMRWIAS